MHQQLLELPRMINNVCESAAYFDACLSVFSWPVVQSGVLGRQVACLSTVSVGIPGGLFLTVNSLASYSRGVTVQAFSGVIVV